MVEIKSIQYHVLPLYRFLLNSPLVLGQKLCICYKKDVQFAPQSTAIQDLITPEHLWYEHYLGSGSGFGLAGKDLDPLARSSEQSRSKSRSSKRI